MPTRDNERAIAAIAFGDTKQALLYFDYVVPLNLISEMLSFSYHASNPERAGEIYDVILKFLPGRLHQDKFADDLLECSLMLMLHKLKEAKQLPIKNKRKIFALCNVNANNVDDLFFANFKRLLNKYKLRDLTIDLTYPTLEERDDDINHDVNPILSIAELKLIDTTKLSWDHLIELRHDKSACRKLRRLRMFACENYTGKSKAFIEDDLLDRVEQYSNVVKSWKIETTQSTLNLVIKSKVLAGSATGVLLSTLLGAPVPALLTALAGVTFGVGNAILEIKRRRLALETDLIDNPVSYIFNVKRVAK